MSRDWYGLGIALSGYEARWVGTDSKHIELYWGDVSEYEVWSPVWIKEKGDKEYKRVTRTPQELMDDLMKLAKEERQYWHDEIQLSGPEGVFEFPKQCPMFQEAERMFPFIVTPLENSQ